MKKAIALLILTISVYSININSSFADNKAKFQILKVDATYQKQSSAGDPWGP